MLSTRCEPFLPPRNGTAKKLNLTFAIQLTNQRQIIVKQFGFTNFQTTLLGSVDGLVESKWYLTKFVYLSEGSIVITIWLGVTLAARKDIGRGYASVLMYIPALLGALLVNLLPSHNRVGLLLSYWVVGAFFLLQGQAPAR